MSEVTFSTERSTVQRLWNLDKK